MTEFYLIRHGEPDWNLTLVKNLHPCRHDFVPLTAHGITQAEELSKNFVLQGADLILSSPYTRALQTAAILAKNLSLPLKVEYDLHERLPDTSFTVSSREELWYLCDQWEYFGGSPKEKTVPWESLDQIRQRVTDVLKRYLNHRGVIVVFHELTMRSIVGIDERIPFCALRTLRSEETSSLETS